MDQLGLERSSSTLICCFIASLASLLVENKRCEAVCTLFGSSLRLAVHAAMEDILADELRQFVYPSKWIEIAYMCRSCSSHREAER
jgi:hypothetical protein